MNSYSLEALIEQLEGNNSPENIAEVLAKLLLALRDERVSQEHEDDE